MLWILFAVLSAVFAALTSILAKVGVNDCDSDVGTALRTTVVTAFSFAMAAMTGSFVALSSVSPRTYVLLALSGVASELSWLCGFKALKYGEVSKVAPIDKSSTVFTILASVLIFGEIPSLYGVLGIVCIGAGLYFMVFFGAKKAKEHNVPTGSSDGKNGKWMLYAWLSAFFAVLTTIIGKLGIDGVPSDMGTALRSVVMLVLVWSVVVCRGKLPALRGARGKSGVFIVLSGLASGASLLCYYRALKDGVVSAVVALDKTSVVLTVLFSALFLHEKLTRRTVLGLVFFTAGTLLLLR